MQPPKLYDDLSCDTLEKRPYKHKLFLLYKIINTSVPNYLMQLIPPRAQQFSGYPLRNQILVPKYFETLHVSRIAQILHNHTEYV